MRLNAAGAISQFGRLGLASLEPLREAAASEDPKLKEAAEATIAKLTAAEDKTTKAQAHRAAQRKIEEFLQGRSSEKN